MVTTTTTAIIEAEMVAYSDELQSIDGQSFSPLVHGPRLETLICMRSEFWRIRSIIESASCGERAHMRRTYPRYALCLQSFVEDLDLIDFQ